MRCLRQLTKEQLKATIFLSKENYDTLDDELRKNYNMEISDFGKLIIPGLFEPPIRTLRATIPENESHIFR